jgi:hypothetical protein
MYDQTITQPTRGKFSGEGISIQIPDSQTANPTRKSRQVLGQNRRYKLWKFIEDNAEKYRATPHSLLAAIATESLGFAVGVSSIIDARKGTGVPWDNAKLTKKRRGTALGRDRSRYLAKAILEICDTLSIRLSGSLAQKIDAIARAEAIVEFGEKQ